MNTKLLILATFALTPAIAHAMQFAHIEIFNGNGSSAGMLVDGGNEAMKENNIIIGNNGQLAPYVASWLGENDQLSITVSDYINYALFTVSWKYTAINYISSSHPLAKLILGEQEKIVTQSHISQFCDDGNTSPVRLIRPGSASVITLTARRRPEKTLLERLRARPEAE